MTLTIEKHVYDAMRRAAEKAAPLEACGLCAGTDGRVTTFYELTNVDASAEHYSMAPAEQFSAIKDMRTKSIGMLAIWHSHPASPAHMSMEDLRLAYTPHVVYLILSIADAGRPDLRGYVMDNGQPSPIDVRILATESTLETP